MPLRFTNHTILCIKNVYNLKCNTIYMLLTIYNFVDIFS